MTEGAAETEIVGTTGTIPVTVPKEDEMILLMNGKKAGEPTARIDPHLLL